MTDQEDQRVAARSVMDRLAMCWHGRQEMRAVIEEEDVDEV